MINSISADSFESITLTNNTPRNTSIEPTILTNNDVIIYRRNTSIFKDYCCIIILLTVLSFLS